MPDNLPRPSTPGEFAAQFHEAYERLAPSFGYATRAESAVPWEKVPEANRLLMMAVMDELVVPLARRMDAVRGELDAIGFSLDMRHETPLSTEEVWGILRHIHRTLDGEGVA